MFLYNLDVIDNVFYSFISLFYFIFLYPDVMGNFIVIPWCYGQLILMSYDAINLMSLLVDGISNLF